MYPKTIPGLYHDRVERNGDRIANHYKDSSSGQWTAITWRQHVEQVRKLAYGLHAHGVQAGDRIAILSETRHEWMLCDLAIVNVGAVTVGIYPTSTVEQTRYILEDAGVDIVFVEDLSQMEKVKQACSKQGVSKTIILFEEAGQAKGPNALGLHELMSQGDPLAQEDNALFEQRWRAIQPDALAMLVYTSGTTGPPKGVMLTHNNIYKTIESIADALPHEPDDLGIVFLPLAHSLQRVASYAGIYTGGTGVFAERLDKIIDHMQSFNPTVQASVPRIYEKVHAKIMGRLEEASPMKQKIFHWAIRVGLEWSRRKRANQSIPVHLHAQHALADKLVLSKLRGIFGGKIRYMISGAAPISIELLEFFHACGILILEGYGLTETTAPATVNRMNQFTFGTVGLDLSVCKTRIADDGEILIKGDNVFVGYWCNEEATKEAFTEDGWFKSGDIGEKDEKGFLTITDRKKEIIITAAGKNISPANIEKLVRMDPLISQCVVVGDRRKYLVALIALDNEELLAMARRLELGETTMSTLVHHPTIITAVQQIIDRSNRELARYETLKYFRILEHDLSVDDDHLTPTLKLKRRNITASYDHLISEMYPA
jgi:long-chain acyl-CoA synthetase